MASGEAPDRKKLMEQQIECLISRKNCFTDGKLRESTRINIVLPPEASQCSWLSVELKTFSPSNTFLTHGGSLYDTYDKVETIQNGEKFKNKKIIISKIAISHDPEWVRK